MYEATSGGLRLRLICLTALHMISNESRSYGLKGEDKSKGETMVLHILHGGVENGDKRWLEKAARLKLRSPSWIAPRHAKPGDEAILFVESALFATARVASEAHPRPDWARRYGVVIDKVRLIEPPISIGIIREKIPEFHWANYPRSITTPSEAVAEKLRRLIRNRRKRGGLDLDGRLLETASIDELRARAVAEARHKAPKTKSMITRHTRSSAVHRYILARAKGTCEGCRNPAPFNGVKKHPYLEPHHTIRLADDGPDHPWHVIALCPSCHSRVHHSYDGDKFNSILVQRLRRIESESNRA